MKKIIFFAVLYLVAFLFWAIVFQTCTKQVERQNCTNVFLIDKFFTYGWQLLETDTVWNNVYCDSNYIRFSRIKDDTLNICSRNEFEIVMYRIK